MRFLKLAAIILAALMLSPGPLLAQTPPKILKAMSEDAPGCRGPQIYRAL